MAAEDPKDADQALNLGFDYADRAFPFFSEKRGDKPTLGELSSFAGAAGATMLGTMYAIVSHNAGPAEAEAWLSRMFGLLGTVVRQKGIPISLTIRATAVSVPLPPESGGAPANAAALPAAPAACSCALDRDGICPTCPAALKELFTKAIAVLLAYMRSMSGIRKPDDPSCKVCNAAYLDAAFASAIFRGAAAEAGRTDAAHLDHLFSMIVQVGAGMGVKEMPLSEEAWARFVEKLGTEEGKTA